MTTLRSTRQDPSTVNEIRQQIARGEYTVDPGVLAAEILWKVGVVRELRKTLAPDTDPAPETGPGLPLGLNGADRSLGGRARRFPPRAA